MAAWKDLEVRLAQGVGSQPGMHVVSIDRGSPLPGWLQTPLTELEQAAGGQMPVLVLNVKGRGVDQARCLLQLRDLERLSRTGGDQGQPRLCRWW